MNYHADYIKAICPNCGRTTFKSTNGSCECGRPLPRAAIVPYDQAWDFTPELVEAARTEKGLRLMGKYNGDNPAQLSAFSSLQYLYLSRYPRFQFEWLSAFKSLKILELDYLPMTSLADVGSLPALEELILTEWRKLSDVTALSGCRRLRVLTIALCSHIVDLAPVASCEGLIYVRYEGKSLRSLEFASHLASLKSLILSCRLEDPSLRPIWGLKLAHLALKKHGLSRDEVNEYRASHPECELTLM